MRLHGYRLTSARAKAGTVSAFVGVAEYDLVALTTDEQRAAFVALCRFAEWRGVGAHTSYGLGRVRLDGTPSSPPIWA